MSDENKFFRFVWRFNALLLALGGLGVLASGAILLLLSIPTSNRYTPTQLEPSGLYQPVPPKDAKLSEFELVTTQPGVIGKAKLFALEKRLVRGADTINSSFSSDAGTQTVNILAVDIETSRAHWLFKGRNRWIVNRTPLAENGENTALALEVIEEDTNKDGKVAPNDRHVFYVYSSARHEVIKLVTADSFGDIQQIGADRLLILCYDGDKGWAATFSLPDYKFLSRIDLPALSP